MDPAARHRAEIGAEALAGEELVRALTARASGATSVTSAWTRSGW